MKADKLDDQRHWFGLASTFLLETQSVLKEGKRVRVRFELQRSTLQPPAVPNSPVFMIANSSGIAPFRAFLQEKDMIAADKKLESPFGKMTLLFGCRNRETDYLFAQELEDFCSRDVLTALFEAFSRDEAT